LVSLQQFYDAFVSFHTHLPNDRQREAIEAVPSQALFLVAGPGTGKTACLVQRILKLVYVDGIPPSGILATTFTKKAAMELRSRILDWGFKLQEVLLEDKISPPLSPEQKNFVKQRDVNQVMTGTLDSLCERLLRDYREPGSNLPVMADEFVSDTLMLYEGLFDKGRWQNMDLDALLLFLYGGNAFGYNISAKVNLLMSLWERRFHDQVDWDSFVTDKSIPLLPGRTIAHEALESYRQALERESLVDFVQLEQTVLERLKTGQLQDFTGSLQVVLVDEYQDTNLLQEQIYFKMAEACGGALTVVGDDDQSLYRFRGATVELFSKFEERYSNHFHATPKKIFLSENYRSTPDILQFVNDFATLDPSFQKVRVAGKPVLCVGGKRDGDRIPVLGMFRPDIKSLSAGLAEFIFKIFRDGGYCFSPTQKIVVNPDGGNVGDCTVLCGSPQETIRSNYPSLPLALRESLRDYEIDTFNPRGESFASIGIVQLIGGLLLECLDPGGAVELGLSGLTMDMATRLREWRDTALSFVSSSACPPGLSSYLGHWVNKTPGKTDQAWPTNISALELLYGLFHFFPELHDDPEGQIYFEVFTRQFSAAEQVGRFSGQWVNKPSDPGLNEKSTKELLRNWLVPIASGVAKVNEEMIQTFPRDRVSILSIHQAKGLEFPMVIVDVGSSFRKDHFSQAFKRFPSKGQLTHILEDTVRPYSSLGRTKRSQINRAFDDLYRQYFVAFSRPQQVLLLVGLMPSHPEVGFVPNIATGWQRDDNRSSWKGDLPFLDI
jgi:DNA helicase-2/ATP-dependent DNA helicase PcrA